ncbi:MAG: C10 family peptidase [Prevotella sp.]|nr:C10 family peptidase [Prevotella sp.]
MKKVTLSLVALLLCLCIQAQHRSEQEAIQIAQEFFAKKQMKKAPRLSVVPQQKVSQQIQRKVASDRKASNKTSGSYIINDEENGRFVIVSADDRMFEVLGYSDNGVFDESQAPCGLLALLESYNVLYDSLSVCKKDVPKQKIRKANFKKIDPLIKSKWNQRSPYNDRCPYDVSKSETERCLSGCVATAMAQVMNYHKYPNQCQGTYSYKTPFDMFLQLDYDTIYFDWSKVQDTYNYYIDSEGHYVDVPERTKEENNEVAKLMYACGVSVSMEYGVGSSGAKSQNIPYAMINYFKYNPNIAYKDKKYYSDDEWDDIILQDLEAGHPILYSGANNFWDGHQFVLDGCDEEGRYSFNFGWSGSSDGFYYLTGTNSIHYNWIQDMVCRITPEEWGIHEDIFTCSLGFHSENMSVRIGDKGKFSFWPRCQSSETTFNETGTGLFRGEVGIGLFDENFNYIKSLFKQDVVDLQQEFVGTIEGNVIYNNETFKNGNNYIIAPYAKCVNSSNPTRIRSKVDTISYYMAHVANDVVKLWPNGKEFNEVVTGVYRATAKNVDGETKEWLVSLERDNSDFMYILTNIDPLVNYSYDNSFSRVSGELNTDGTLLTLSRYLYGNDSKLVTYPNKNEVVLHLDAQNFSMSIDGDWGCAKTSDEETTKEISHYTETTFTYINPSELEIIVNNNVAGDLSSHLNDSTFYLFVERLTITGDLNGTDFKLINKVQDDGRLAYLDISEANIVEGGTTYNFSYKTQNNVVSSFMFSGDNLLSVKLPNTTEKIERYAFNSCDKLKEVIIGANVDNIRDNAFSDCPVLETINVDAGNQSYCTFNGALYTNDLKRLLLCPNGLIVDEYIIYDGTESIAEHAFDGCANIISIDIPTSVREIGGWAFTDCKELRYLKLPEGLTEMKHALLWGCKKLTTLNMPSTLRNIETSVFEYCESLVMIYSDIKMIDSLKVDSSSYHPIKEYFKEIPDTCTWMVPSGPVNNIEKYANRYVKQPWWIPTWRITIDPIPEEPDGIGTIRINDDKIGWVDENNYYHAINDGFLKVYSINGSTSKILHVKRGNSYPLELYKGMYIVNNKKVLVQ